MPRIDAETGHGLMTDVALKRKLRNFVQLVKGAQPPYDIYIKEKAVLEQTHRKAYEAIGASDELTEEGDAKAKKKRKGSADSVDKARAWICQNFFDVRSFGAVMSTGVNCGQVRGPVQLIFARSADPIVASEHSITRMAVATEAEAEKQQGDNRTMGPQAHRAVCACIAGAWFCVVLPGQADRILGRGRPGVAVASRWNTCSSTTDQRHAARCRRAGSLCSSTTASWAMHMPTSLFERIKVKLKTGGCASRSFSDYGVERG